MKKIERLFGSLENEANEPVIIVREADLDQLERERDEAVDALIEDAIELDKCRPHTLGAIGIKLWSTLDKRIALIERLTGQEWQELKEMKGC